MRVITGLARGKKLKAPGGLNTRPITDMIKEALFNVWGQDIVDSQLLDLFAGSGSVGIEALSRGAQKVVFVDNNAEAIRIIKENLTNCGFSQGFEIYRNDVFRAIELLKRNKAKFDYIYVDPPFTNDKIFNEIIISLDKTDLYSAQGTIVIRTQKNKEMPAELSSIKKFRLSNYGESSLHYYGRYEEGPHI